MSGLCWIQLLEDEELSEYLDILATSLILYVLLVLCYTNSPQPLATQAFGRYQPKLVQARDESRPYQYRWTRR